MYLLQAVDELVTTFFREVFLGEELLTAIPVVGRAVLVLLRNAIVDIVLYMTS